MLKHMLHLRKTTFFIWLICGSVFCFSALGQPPIVLTDKGGNPTEVEGVVHIRGKNALQELKDVLALARAAHLSVTVRGAQHSQGGHSLAPNGIVLDLRGMRHAEMIAPDVLRVQAGATWKEVLDFLTPLGLSVEIMQSDYDFSVGGALSTNVHGWTMGMPPFVQSVRGFHLMTASGQVLYCSRTENVALFRAIIGGYGLLGIVIDVDLHVVPNNTYVLSSYVVDTSNFIPFFKDTIARNPKARFFFGRFNLNRRAFLQKILVRVYEDTGRLSEEKTLQTHPFIEKRVQGLFKRTRGSELFKKIRWEIEANPWIVAPFKQLARSQILYHTVDVYTTKRPDEVDLLQEYFIPLDQFEAFVAILQSIEGALEKPLMGITLRHVMKDHETLLPYAKEDMVCFVFFFRGPKTASFDAKIGAISRYLTAGALALGGRYYLPYRPYQTKAQFQQAYPGLTKLLDLKKHYDPLGIFKNQFYQRYFEATRPKGL